MSYLARAAKVGVASPSSEAASRTVHVKLDAKVVGYRKISTLKGEDLSG